MDTKHNILNVTRRLDPVYARREYLSRIHSRWVPEPSDEDVTAYLKETIGSCVRALCDKAAERLTADLVAFVSEQLKKTNPWVALSNADALNTLGRDSILLRMRDDVLEQAIKCQLEYFDAAASRLVHIEYRRDKEGSNDNPV